MRVYGISTIVFLKLGKALLIEPLEGRTLEENQR